MKLDCPWRKKQFQTDSILNDKLNNKSNKWQIKWSQTVSAKIKSPRKYLQTKCVLLYILFSWEGRTRGEFYLFVKFVYLLSAEFYIFHIFFAHKIFPSLCPISLRGEENFISFLMLIFSICAILYFLSADKMYPSLYIILLKEGKTGGEFYLVVLFFWNFSSAEFYIFWYFYLQKKCILFYIQSSCERENWWRILSSCFVFWNFSSVEFYIFLIYFLSADKMYPPLHPILLRGENTGGEFYLIFTLGHPSDHKLPLVMIKWSASEVE